MEDEKIIDLYWERDQVAIVKTEEKYGTYCGSIAGHILSSREDCEECLNDTWLAAWNSMPKARPAILSSFLGAITRNLSLDCYRRQHAAKRGGGQVPYVFEELSDCVSRVEPVHYLEEQELAESLNRFLRTLPSQKRAIFVRRYWYMDSVAEIAECCGYSESNVKTLLFRLRRNLHVHLQKEGFVV